MLESSDFAGTPLLDYEAWRAFIRSDFGAEPKVIEPSAFAGWRRSPSVSADGGQLVAQRMSA